MPEPLLRMSGISKNFPGVRALDRVDLDLNASEVHALAGENGAGKSTLMKILSGVYRADEGEIWLRGEKVTATGPRAMLKAGVSVIYQELNLVPYLSVAENIFLGREPRRPGGFIDWTKMRRDVTALLEPFGLVLDPRARVNTLGPAYQQVVEIAKALSLRSDILVMDEPTAALTGREVDRLFEVIRGLRRSGVSVIYISHRLQEIKLLADRVTVLRDGRRIATSPVGAITVDEIIRHMVGRTLTEQFPKGQATPGKEILRVEGLSRRGVCNDVSFSLRRGEILGLAGLVGAGRTEIVELVYGAKRRDAGRILVDGREVNIRSTRDAVRSGIALIPEERKKQGLVLGMSVFDNIALTVLDLHSAAGLLRRRALVELVARVATSVRVKTPSLNQLVRYLSGGNQQKVVLSKWFVRNCDVYIFDEPTRGIDVGAKVEIYRLMQDLAARGAGIIMVSSELHEVMNMSDRIAVVWSGRIVGEFARGEASDELVMSRALGLHAQRTP
ncbi:MAG TPA: sugar ABC transporter ATP-binding protein [Anaeromyxobacteraceae bacterium]|nr:sugar ABC transporter ATP-binding protein [Anaeromyxobacteraceae bacterium]